MGHVVGDEAEVARVHPNAIGAKDRADLGHELRTRGLHAEGAQHRAHVVGGDSTRVHDVAVGPGALKVDAVRLHRQRGALLTRLLLHHVAPVDACAAQPISVRGILQLLESSVDMLHK